MFASISALGACKKSADTVKPSAVDVPKTRATNGDHSVESDEDLDTGRLAIEPRLAAMCSLTEPNFDFDSSALSSSARGTLDALADCLLDGPAKDQRLQLVGHADPRGDEPYNLSLGQRRATKVESYLRDKGVANDHMETSSRGELDATGTDEATWGPDRRVDIALMQ
ncbi:MAG: OmpA family protein [Nannocystaceae bacterium]